MEKQQGSPVILSVYLIMILLGCTVEEDYPKTGRWMGLIETEQGEAELILDYEADSPKLSIPSQGLVNVPVKDVHSRGSRIRFTIHLGPSPVRFEGKIGNAAISGKYLQGDNTNDFSIEWSGPIPSPTPVHIMEAAGEDRKLILSVGRAGLSGRLRIPFRDEGEWAALIIPGSGPTDGDGNSLLMDGKNNSLLRLANFLASQGIPSLRIDKRGTGMNASGREAEEELVFDRFVEDAKGWIGKLIGLYPSRRILVIGHSQGALVGMLAANGTSCDALISIAGSGESIDKTLEQQMKNLGEQIKTEGDRILSELRQGRTVDDVPLSLHPLFRPSVQPFLISYMAYDPADVMGEADYPVLIVQGGMDRQTGLSDAKRLTEALNSAELAFIPSMNHLLRDVEDELENRRTYGEDSLPLSPGLKKAIRDFINRGEE